MLVNSQVEFERDVNERISAMSDIEKRSYDEYQRNVDNVRHYYLSKGFPQTLWSSFFIYFYGRFELEMNNICLELKGMHGYRLAPSDLSGNGIFQSKNYLVKVVGIDNFEQSELWKEIVFFNKIRNCFAHNDGQIKETNTDIKHYIENIDGINIIHKKYIETERVYIERTIKVIYNFYDELFASLDEKGIEY